MLNNELKNQNRKKRYYFHIDRERKRGRRYYKLHHPNYKPRVKKDIEEQKLVDKANQKAWHIKHRKRC